MFEVTGMAGKDIRGAWVRFVAGQVPFSTHARIVLPVIGIYAALLAIAAVLHEIPFAFHAVCVSNLGNPAPGQNPGGWWLFTVAMVGASPFMVAHANYIHRRFLPAWPRYAAFLRGLMVTGSIGMALVGIINETTWNAHATVAVLAFGGLGLPVILSIPLLVKKRVDRDPWPSTRGIILLVAMVVVTGTCIMLLLGQGPLPPTFGAASASEWLFLGGIVAWLLAILAMARDPVPDLAPGETAGGEGP